MSDIELVKQLRDSTGLSFKEIRKALDEASGDENKALEMLKARGAEIAEKKSVRTTQEGIVEAYVHSTKKVGALVEVLCETDFVARNPLFVELSHEVAMQVAAMEPETVADLLGQQYIKDPSLTIQELINQYVAKLGENIKIGRFTRLQI
ncbi:MAG: elongation factor Ts [Candidatus Yanofskybacteria bacterium]|nr:elongation factor Ts [Candidatus Yanofskybacteria bacterium]